jgi:hypothetical protein
MGDGTTRRHDARWAVWPNILSIGTVGGMAPDRVPAPWSELLAVGCVADDVSAFGIARYAGVDLATADAALAEAVAAGVLTADGVVDEKFAARAVADLPVERAAEVHAVVARHLLAAGPERVVDAVRHARAASHGPRSGGAIQDPWPVRGTRKTRR